MVLGERHRADLILKMERSYAGAKTVLIRDLDMIGSVADKDVRPAGEVDVRGDVLLAGVGERICHVLMVAVASKTAICTVGLIPLGFEESVVKCEKVPALETFE